MPTGIYNHKPHTIEHKKNIAKAHLGNKHSEITKKKIGRKQKGRKHTPQEKFKIGHKQFNTGRTWFKKGRMGKEAGHWIDGRTKLNHLIRESSKYKQWRSDIFKRDNWTCQTCGLRGVYLEAHHIKNFSKIVKENNIKTLKQALKCKELWEIINGVTLCKECHNLTKGKKIN